MRIGDLIENAGPVADVAIFRAPDLGTTGAVSTDRIVEAIRPHQLIDIDTRGLAEVIVTRASRAIGAQEISASIAQALSRQYGLGEPHNISLNFDLPVHTLQVESGATGELQVLCAQLRPAQRPLRRDARFAVEPGAATAARSFHRQARSKRSMPSPSIVRSNAARCCRPPTSPCCGGRRRNPAGLSTVSAALGLAARRQLHPGQPIHAADLMKPEIVQRNDTVTLVYEAPGLVLTLRGKAQDAGALGDTIGVLNDQTKRVVQGVVSGPGRVMVANATTHLVDNAPAPAPALDSASAAPKRQE